jgi:uncharacterized protein (DUF433 family)
VGRLPSRPFDSNEILRRVRIGIARGAYTAERTAALSGVPLSTLHYWARNEVLTPSISATRVKLWSYTDLMGLRTIYWLRQRKTHAAGWEIPASAMPSVRRALAALRDLDLELWTEDGGPSVRVDPGGQIFIVTQDAGPATVEGAQVLDPNVFDLIAPFRTHATRAPDLAKPRPNLRIVPGKLSGSPHIAHTRIETVAIASLADRGFDSARIEKLYPSVRPRVALVEAVDLERQLSENLKAAA